MEATDHSCIENLSANLGRRGNKGVTGPTGSPGIPGEVGPPGLPGASGTSLIDVSLNYDEGKISVTSRNYVPISYLIYPGSTAWDRDILNIKVACSFDKADVNVNDSLKLEIKVIDITNNLEILSTSLLLSEVINVSNITQQVYSIVTNGDTLNSTTTLQNIPSDEAIFRIDAKAYKYKPGILVQYAQRVNIYAIELY